MTIGNAFFSKIGLTEEANRQIKSYTKNHSAFQESGSFVEIAVALITVERGMSNHD
jgi:hypothetical protein